MSSTLLGRVPSDPKDLTPQWLTARLRQSGALPTGSVRSLAVTPAPKWNLALCAHLKLDYDQASADAPRRLFTKIATIDDPFADIFLGEYKFYAEASGDGLPIARCFGAYRDPVSHGTCILLEDLSETHEPTPWPLPPRLDRCEAAVVALARLHAHWWQGEPIETAALAANEDRLGAAFQGFLPGFRERLGDRLPPDRFDTMRAVCDRLPALKKNRLAAGRPVTRAHGDAHLWNVMYPKGPARHGCVFIDWEDWRTDMGAGDLAYMIALHWYPDRRARHEEPLLRIYLEALHREAPTGYGWDELLVDYRLGHLQNIVVPIFQEQAGQAHGSWWSHLERWFLAFDDLDCGQLL